MLITSVLGDRLYNVYFYYACIIKSIFDIITEDKAPVVNTKPAGVKKKERERKKV